MIGKHKILLIAAVDENWAIGKNNQLLYHIPEDMKFFRKTTEGNIVVYGSKTLRSFPNAKPLPNRTNIVLSSHDIKGIDTAHSVQEIVDKIAAIHDNRPVFICGGASVYRQFLDMCDGAYITHINAKAEGADAFLPNLIDEGWIALRSVGYSRLGLSFQFVYLEKPRGKS